MRAVLLAATLGVVASVFAGTPSGLKVGDFAQAFEPHHVSGPDANTDTCPVCKYGLLPGVLVWVNGEHAADVVPMAKALEADLGKKGLEKYRAFFVFYNPGKQDVQAYEKRIGDLAKRAGLKRVAFTVLPSPKHEAAQLYKVSAAPDVKTSIQVYRKVRVREVFTNLAGKDSGKLLAAIQRQLNAK